MGYRNMVKGVDSTTQGGWVSEKIIQDRGKKELTLQRSASAKEKSGKKKHAEGERQADRKTGTNLLKEIQGNGSNPSMREPMKYAESRERKR